jgi:hypothetical protein
MPFLGPIVFECIGALVRWLFFLARNNLTGKGLKSFNEIWNDKKGSGSKEMLENTWLILALE